MSGIPGRQTGETFTVELKCHFNLCSPKWLTTHLDSGRVQVLGDGRAMYGEFSCEFVHGSARSIAFRQSGHVGYAQSSGELRCLANLPRLISGRAQVSKCSDCASKGRRGRVREESGQDHQYDP